MREAVIVSAARTGIGRAFRGSLNKTHGATITAHVIKHAVEHAKIDPAEVEDVVIGCGLPEGATGHNIGRVAALRAGLPITTFCEFGRRGLNWLRRCISSLKRGN